MAEATGSPSAFGTDDEIVKCFTGDELMNSTDVINNALRKTGVDEERHSFDAVRYVFMVCRFTDGVDRPSKKIDCRIIDSKPLREGE